MLKNKKFLLLAILAYCSLMVNAQSTNSPYSRYGYGVLKDHAIGASRAMGGIAYGLRRGINVNPANPASYSKVDSLTFIFDIGIDYARGTLSDGVNKQADSNGGLDYVSMLMPLSKDIGFSFGLLPYSAVGYSFGSVEQAGGVSYQKMFSGGGAFSQVYGGISYEFLNSVSVGANVSYLFGTINHTRSLPVMSESLSYTSVEYRTLTLNSLKLDLGVQYEMPLSKSDKLVLGAVFSPAMGASARFSQISYNLTSSTKVDGDTVYASGLRAGLPRTFGAGFTWARNNKILVGADITYQGWSNIRYPKQMSDGLSDAERFNNRWKFSTGIEYVVDPYDRNYFKRIRIRGGANYSNSYLNVKNSDNQIGGYKEYGLTFGFGFPIRDNYTQRASYINIGFEYLSLRPEFSNMIREEYFGVNINVNINDLWFMKNKFR